ncbi:MAG: Lin0512 family protein [Actinomycetota bacterium]
MSLVRWITEMGMGVDVHGGDYTKAARRAVSDALRHSSLNFFEAAGKTVHDMHVEVVIAVHDPAAIDTDAIAGEVPYGTVVVTPVLGGLDVPAPRTGDHMVIANAALLVSFENGEEPIGVRVTPSPTGAG